jgi:DNA-binding GntR family transcriptional regulator
MTTVSNNRACSVQDSVYVALRNSIANLNLVPGTAVSEKEIALKFNVSRTPVREAFIHLSHEGLVQVYPQKETRVSFIDFIRVEQELFLRASLENAILELFIKKCGSKDFETLDALMEKQSEVLKANDYTEFIDHDDHFHQLFFKVAGQSFSWDVLDRMSGHYHRARLLTIWLKGIADDLVGQHQKIYNALKKKDLEMARKSLYIHIHKLDMEEKILREKFPAYLAPINEGDAFDVDFGGFPHIS